MTKLLYDVVVFNHNCKRVSTLKTGISRALAKWAINNYNSANKYTVAMLIPHESVNALKTKLVN